MKIIAKKQGISLRIRELIDAHVRMKGGDTVEGVEITSDEAVELLRDLISRAERLCPMSSLFRIAHDPTVLEEVAVELQPDFGHLLVDGELIKWLPVSKESLEILKAGYVVLPVTRIDKAA